jgi:hypothetical protein
MENFNKYSGWYGRYKKEKPKAPYRIVKIENDRPMPVSGLENERIEAFSPAQARILFIKKYPKLSDYLSMGAVIEAQLDDETLRQRQQIEKIKKKDLDEKVQNAWWND